MYVFTDTIYFFLDTSVLTVVPEVATKWEASPLRKKIATSNDTTMECLIYT